jgi:hypothetical protein
MDNENKTRWILLIYNLPTKPSNFRVKIWRRIQKLGAVGIRNSGYILPNKGSCLEDFQWLKREIVDLGGEASIFFVNSVDDLENAEIERLFNESRNHDYGAVIKDCRELSNQLNKEINRDIAYDKIERYESKFKKIVSRFNEISNIDFFSASIGLEAENELEKFRICLSQIREPEPETVGLMIERVDKGSLKGKIWVTRKELHIDRIASGWFIRKFIDNGAKFDFINEDEYVQKEDHITFDMYDAEFGHHGEYCTFEIFIRRLGLINEYALTEIAEIVHDIDLKDAKFGRIEVSGIDGVITGLGKICKDDYHLLELGEKIFDALYARMQ